MGSDPYQLITEQIIERLKQGVVPWRKPWYTENPKNLLSKREYRGVNSLLLGSAPYTSPYWLTYRQAQQSGGYVRRGEHAQPVVFWKWIAKERDDKEIEYPILRFYRVFNTEQCDGLESKIPESPIERFDSIDRAEEIVNGMLNPPQIVHAGQSAFYQPAADTVTMPPKHRFFSLEEYFSTLYHELTHSVGHPSRLHRFEIDGTSAFSSRDYSIEELIAEMGASFLCNESRIAPQTLDNSVAYIGSWLHSLENDPKMVVYAGARAQRAADYILNLAPSSQYD